MSKNKNRILGTYQVRYHSNDFIQTFQVISEYDWNNILLPIKRAISIIEEYNKGKENIQSKSLKESLKLIFDDYDTCIPVGGPMEKSIKTGIISLPETQGGDHQVSWKRIS